MQVLVGGVYWRVTWLLPLLSHISDDETFISVGGPGRTGMNRYHYRADQFSAKKGIKAKEVQEN